MAPAAAIIVTFPPLHIAVTDGVRTGVIGMLFTVIVVVAAQPLSVYEISTLPAETPVTVPEGPTVAIVLFVVLHTPPEETSVMFVVWVGQTLVTPVIADGTGLTVIVIIFELTAPGTTQLAELTIVQAIVFPVARNELEYVEAVDTFTPFNVH